MHIKWSADEHSFLFWDFGPKPKISKKGMYSFLGSRGEIEISIKHEKIPITYYWVEEKLQNSIVSFMYKCEAVHAKKYLEEGTLVISKWPKFSFL